METIQLTLTPASLSPLITGRRLIIRPISSKELNQHYVDWLNDPMINEFLEVRHEKQTVERTVEYINSLRTKKGCDMLAILTKGSQKHIGNISIVDYNPNNQGYVIFGIMIGDLRAQELGLGAEAIAGFIEYVFSDPAVRRIEGSVIADNDRCWKTLESFGFRREGVLRDRAVLAGGKVTDRYLYGLLRKDWNQKDEWRIYAKN